MLPKVFRVYHVLNLCFASINGYSFLLGFYCLDFLYGFWIFSIIYYLSSILILFLLLFSTLPAGCENGCSRHGQCTLENGEYRCDCIEGWAGSDCSIALEMNCKDNIDNDGGKYQSTHTESVRSFCSSTWAREKNPIYIRKYSTNHKPHTHIANIVYIDGMTDCSDSECCSHPACSEHIMCLSSNDPVEVLLRKQPPSVTASFYQRVKFLIEENSVQSYAHMDEYSEK